MAKKLLIAKLSTKGIWFHFRSIVLAANCLLSDISRIFKRETAWGESLLGLVNLPDADASVDARRGMIFSLDTTSNKPLDADASNSVDARRGEIFLLDARRHIKKACRRGCLKFCRHLTPKKVF